MDNNRYELLLERAVSSIEQQKGISSSLLEVSKGLKDNMKIMNEEFILHTQQSSAIFDDVELIKKDLIKWMKVILILLFSTVGGLSIIKIVGIDFIKSLI